MGLRKLATDAFNAAKQSVPGQIIGSGIMSSLNDTVLEYFRCENLSDEVLLVPATKVMRNGAVNKGSEGVITNGSVFDVAVNQAAVLIENGRVHDFVIGVTNGQVDTTGRYKYDSSLEPSCISGGLKDIPTNLLAQGLNAVDRMRFGGQSSNTMRLVYINLKEIKGQKIGIGAATFYDNRYNLSLELKGHGTFTYRINDPVSFYNNMMYDPTRPLLAKDILEELRGNISTVLDPTIGAIENVCQRGYVDIKKHSHELAGYANQFLKERGVWQNRGLELVEISLSLQPTEETKAKVDKMEQAQAFSNPGMAAGLQAQGMFNAMSGIGEGAAKGGGSNGGMDSMGAMMGMMGMSMMNNMQQNQYAQAYAQPVYGQMQQMPGYQNPYANQMPQQMPQAPGYPMQQNPQPGYAQQPMNNNPYGQPTPAPTAPTQPEVVEPTAPTPQPEPTPTPTPTPTPAPAAAPVVGWTCACGSVNQGKFCMECGSKKPAEAPLYRCDKCGWTPSDPHNPPKFCPECGDRFDDDDAQ